jgi:hypothetical protein
MQPVRDSASREANGKRPEFVVGSSYFYRPLLYEILKIVYSTSNSQGHYSGFSPKLALFSLPSSSADRVKRVLRATFDHFGKQGIKGLRVKNFSLSEGEARVREI